MIQALKKLGLFLLSSTVIGAATLGTLHYTDVMSVQPLLDWINLQSGELATIGFSGTFVTIGTLLTRSVVTAMLNQSKSDNRIVLTKVYEALKIVEEQNLAILEYNKLMATKNIESRALTIDQKIDIKNWLAKVDPTLVKTILDYIPDDIELQAKEILTEKATDIINLIKKV